MSEIKKARTAILVALVLLVVVFVFADTIDSLGSSDTFRYREIGRQSLAWQWYDSLPYSEIDAMCWNEIDGFCDIQSSRPQLLYTIVDTQSLEVTEIWHDRRYGTSRYFAWTFIERRGLDNHPHPIRAVWVELH